MTIPQHPCARPSLEEHEADLVVVGGGMSGVCAAIAAARTGARTIIVQDRPVFGGSGSSEIRVPVSGAASSNAWAAEGGLIHEIMLEDRATSPGGPRPTDSHLDLILDDRLERTDGLEVLRSTVVHDVELTGPAPGDGRRSIVAVRGTQLGSERRVRLRARHFLDATGDAALAALAGARTRYGREARSEFGESLAPVRADDSSLGSTITMQARRLDRPVPFRAPSWAIDYDGVDLAFDRTMPRVSGDVLSGFWWVEVNDPFHQIHDNQAIRRQLHRHVLGLWDHLKNRSDQREELENFHLEWIGQIPGKRESRRVRGEVTITQHDVVDGARWSDEIGTAGWWIDLHVKGGVDSLDEPAERENVDRFYRGLARVAPFSIPLRACVSADLANLWVTGRCISATHVGLGPIRVQQTLAQLGQGVGTAAAMALGADLGPRQLAADPARVAALQQRLLRDDVRLLSTRADDPRDLARSARVIAPAAPLVLPDEPTSWVEVADGLAQVVPDLGGGEDRTVGLLLRNPSDSPASVRLVAETIETIWDRQCVPHGVAESQELGEIRLQPGAEGIFSLPWPRPATETPVRLVVHPAGDRPSHLQWAAAEGKPPTATLSESLIVAPGGPESHNARLPSFDPAEIEIPAYRLWRQHRRRTQVLRIDPPARPFEAVNATNGWAFPGRGANLWVSPPQLPATLELDWPAPVRISEVHLALDTDLDTGTDHRDGLTRAVECASSLRIEVRCDGAWQKVAQVEGNYQRRCRLRFPTVSADALRLTVLSTNGDPHARLYEIRVYEGDPAGATA